MSLNLIDVIPKHFYYSMMLFLNFTFTCTAIFPWKIINLNQSTETKIFTIENFYKFNFHFISMSVKQFFNLCFWWLMVVKWKFWGRFGNCGGEEETGAREIFGVEEKTVEHEYPGTLKIPRSLSIGEILEWNQTVFSESSPQNSFSLPTL